MKIKELIETLKEFPEDMELLICNPNYYAENFIFYKDGISYCEYSTHWNIYTSIHLFEYCVYSWGRTKRSATKYSYRV